MPETPVASIVSPSLATASASRSEPGPLSLVFVTTMIVAGNALPTGTIPLLALTSLAKLWLLAFRCASANGIAHIASLKLIVRVKIIRFDRSAHRIERRRRLTRVSSLINFDFCSCFGLLWCSLLRSQFQPFTGVQNGKRRGVTRKLAALG